MTANVAPRRLSWLPWPSQVMWWGLWLVVATSQQLPLVSTCSTNPFQRQHTCKLRDWYAHMVVEFVVDLLLVLCCLDFKVLPLQQSLVACPTVCNSASWRAHYTRYASLSVNKAEHPTVGVPINVYAYVLLCCHVCY
jgi:hypothetical protein